MFLCLGLLLSLFYSFSLFTCITMISLRWVLVLYFPYLFVIYICIVFGAQSSYVYWVLLASTHTTLLLPADHSKSSRHWFGSRAKQILGFEDWGELLTFEVANLPLFWLGLVFMLYSETVNRYFIFVKALYSYSD